MTLNNPFKKISKNKFLATRFNNYDKFIEITDKWVHENATGEEVSVAELRVCVEVMIRYLCQNVCKWELGDFNKKQSNLERKFAEKKLPIEKKLTPVSLSMVRELDRDLAESLKNAFDKFSKYKSHDFTSEAEAIELNNIFIVAASSFFIRTFNINLQNVLDENKSLMSNIIEYSPSIIHSEQEGKKVAQELKVEKIRGWVRQVSEQINPFTKVKERHVVFVSHQRGFTASNRATLTMSLTDLGQRVSEGLTYEIEFCKIGNQNVIKKIVAWEKPAIFKLFLNEVEPIFVKIFKKLSGDEIKISEYMLETSVKEHDEHVEYQRHVKKIGTKSKELTGFLLKLDRYLSQKSLHWIDAFTDLKLLNEFALSEKGESVQLNVFANINTSIDFVEQILNNITDLNKVYALRNQFDDKAFEELNRKSSFADFSNLTSLMNPSRISANYMFIVQNRLSQKRFLNEFQLRDMIALLVFRAAHYENDLLNSSLLKVATLRTIIFKIMKVFESMNFYEKEIENLISKSSQKQTLMIYELTQWFKNNSAYESSSTLMEIFIFLKSSDTRLFESFEHNGEEYVLLVSDANKIHPHSTLATEIKFANQLKALFKNQKNNNPVSVGVEIFEKNKLNIDEAQLKAITSLFNNNVSVLNGKAGSGKTTTIALFLKEYQRLNPNSKIFVGTPTGAAASVFKLSLQKIGVNMKNILVDTTDANIKSNFKPSVMIFEESSMIKMYNVVKQLSQRNYIENYEKVIFLGDDGQLPSIGIGNLLNEFKKSNKFQNRIIELSTNHRQKDSEIFKLANLIRDYSSVDEKLFMDSLSKFYNTFSTEIVDVNKSNMKSENDFLENLIKNYDPKIRRVILTPKNLGVLGVKNLNDKMQSNLNVNDLSWLTDLETYSINSRVVWIKNMRAYYKDRNTGNNEKILVLSNGTEGIITRVEKSKTNHNQVDFVEIDFGNSLSEEQLNECLRGMGNTKTYEASVPIENIWIENGRLKIKYQIEGVEQNSIPFVLNFATSFHKAQGGQFDYVDIILESPDDLRKTISKQHLYTALTRAIKKVNIWVVSQEGVEYICNIAGNVEERNQLLSELIDDKILFNF